MSFGNEIELSHLLINIIVSRFCISIKVTRPSGQTNPKYESTFVFTNDFPALLEECPDPPESEDPLFVTEAAKGTCRVMCFSPKSNITLPLMAVGDIIKVIALKVVLNYHFNIHNR